MAPRGAVVADARWFGDHGIGRFAHNVISRLPDCLQLRSGPRPLSVWDPLWLSLQIANTRPSVFFSPGFNPPAFSTATPLVITIHDLAHVQLPALATYERRLYYKLLVRPASLRAYRVITVSEYSRLEILKWTGLPESCVVNVSNGVDPVFRPEGPQYRPDFRYILYVGALRPHKNIPRLLSAFKKIDSGIKLVLTGKRTPAVGALLQDLGLESRVYFTGAVDDQTLASLYRGAVCLVLPSLIEGFGLPAAEAIACGTPAVVSRSAALPEVVGNAALLVDPLDEEDIRGGMERLIGDSYLRERLRKAGLERAKLFCWDEVAGKVHQVIQEARNAG